MFFSAVSAYLDSQKKGKNLTIQSIHLDPTNRNLHQHENDRDPQEKKRKAARQSSQSTLRL